LLLSVRGVEQLFLLASCLAIVTVNGAPYDPDEGYNITRLIESKGYPCERHRVITADGYILGVFRIPYGRNKSASSPGRPVLLQHGLIDAATTWVLNFAEQSLGFVLADAGYDVWLGNMRGNYYSRAHVKYDPDHDDAFWDFSWDDMARDDLPSMIAYILNATQQTQLAYVGHSQGTLIAFAEFGRSLGSLQNNVSFFGALAPIVKIAHTKSPIKYLAGFSQQLADLLYLLFGRNEFLPSSEYSKWLARYVCDQPVPDELICANTLFLICGPEKKNLNETRIPVYFAHEPDGTSAKNIIHFAQGVQSGNFQAFDYGSAQANQMHYNQSTPPLYGLSEITVPTAIFWSDDDWLADPEDVSYIFENMRSIVYEKFIPGYNHLDFIWALTANQLIYRDLIRVMHNYHPAS
jgi:pimeloyl-ACP methyl ester carboxylesterase